MAESAHSDSESEDHSKDPLEDDREVLREDEEREKLLTTSKVFKDGRHEEDGGRKDRRRSKQRERKRRPKRESKLEGISLYRMEEGGGDSSSQLSSRGSIESLSEHKTASSRTRVRIILPRFFADADILQRLRVKILHITLISVTIVMSLCLLTLGAYKMSEDSRKRRKGTTAIMSNGTSKFAPTTILISLDGFRADFLNRGLTPTLNSFVAEGVSPRYMLPSFPSVTFPNHYTIITGLYPESHGIVSNSFWDPDLKEEFFYTDPARSMQPKWWSEGEPLWVTAAKQNVKSAIHMWPGSEAHIQLEPAFLDKFNGTEVLSRKVDRVLEFIDLPSEHDPAVATITKTRPQFIAFYVPNVDADGHLHGPNSTEIRTTISNVDTMLGDLFAALEKRNLTDIVNVVVVSDHGMASTSIDRLIQLDDLVDLSLIEHIDGWPLHGLRPKDQKDLRQLYDQLTAASAKNPNFHVYLRDENMPERYHFTNNKRIAPLWIVPKTGWAILEKRKFNIQEAKNIGRIYQPRGLHGYDHEHPLMRAIFIARGPAFPHQPNSRLDVFRKSLSFFLRDYPPKGLAILVS